MSLFRNFFCPHARGFLRGEGGSLGRSPSCAVGHSVQLRFFSGGAAKPTWAVPQHRRFGPTLPDNAYYGEHATYNYFVLFIRGLRPYLEKILGDCALTVKNIALGFYHPLKATVVKHNPEFRLAAKHSLTSSSQAAASVTGTCMQQAVAFASFFVTHMAITSRFNEMYQRLVDVTSLLEVQAAQEHASEGFWQSASEQQEERLQKHAEHHKQLEEEWDQALRAATVSRSFDVLVSHLSKPATSSDSQRDSAHETSGHGVMTRGNEVRSTTHAPRSAQEHGHHEATFMVPPTIMWNFNALPYGRDNPDTKTFPIPGHEQPHRAFALSFTSNNLSGNWGDYIDRQDNKNAIMRPARMMFTDAFIPPTK